MTGYVKMAKTTYASRVFNANQKVWLQYMSGDQAALVTGKHRGKGRYVSAWIKWGRNGKTAPKWKQFEVSDAFAKEHSLQIHFDQC